MKPCEIKKGCLYTNGQGQYRRVLDIGPQYKLYPGLPDRPYVFYEMVKFENGEEVKPPEGNPQYPMTIEFFASWVKEVVSKAD